MTHVSSYKYTASICCMYKNESLHMVEWIEYHRMIGFQHFYLYNNRSDDNFPIKFKDGQLANKSFRKSIIDYYVSIGVVTHNEYDIDLSDSNFAGCQSLPSYPFNHCSRTYKSESEWIAYIDMDEFIAIKNSDKNIVDILNQHFNHVGGILLNSVLFGTSGHYFEPKGLILDNYNLHATQMDPYVKTISKPSHILGYYGPHAVRYSEGTLTANGSGVIISNNPINHEHENPILVIHHYLAKSMWYWYKFKLGRVFDRGSILEMERPDGWHEDFTSNEIVGNYKLPSGPTLRAHYTKESHRNWDIFNGLKFNEIYNDSMKIFIPALSNIIELLPFYNLSASDIDRFAVNPIDPSDRLSCWIDSNKYESRFLPSFLEKSKNQYSISNTMKYYFLFDLERDNKPFNEWITNSKSSMLTDDSSEVTNIIE